MTTLVSVLTLDGRTVDVNPANLVALYEVDAFSCRIIGPSPADDLQVLGDASTISAVLAPWVSALFFAVPNGVSVWVNPAVVTSVFPSANVPIVTSRIVMACPANDIIVAGDAATTAAALGLAPSTTGGVQQPTIIVGNRLAGDNRTQCNYLDEGDGVALYAVIAEEGGFV
jgi:hypothetical protein